MPEIKDSEEPGLIMTSMDVGHIHLKTVSKRPLYISVSLFTC